MTVNCSNCNKEIDEDVDTVRFIHDNRYCEECFFESYDYCYVCDRLIDLNNDDWYTDGDERVCNSCHMKEENKPKYPDNPDVSDSDRAVVLKLARQFVQTLGTDKFVLRTKPGDYRMKEIADAVGKISKPICLFGIKNQEKYRVLATQDIIGLVIQYFADKSHIVGNKEIVLNKGYLRLGLDHALRSIHFDKCVELIKYISANKHAMRKVNVRVARAHTGDPEVMSASSIDNPDHAVDYQLLIHELALGVRSTITDNELSTLIRREPGRIESIAARRYRDRATDAIYIYDSIIDLYHVQSLEEHRPEIRIQPLSPRFTWDVLPDAATTYGITYGASASTAVTGTGEELIRGREEARAMARREMERARDEFLMGLTRREEREV